MALRASMGHSRISISNSRIVACAIRGVCAALLLVFAGCVACPCSAVHHSPPSCGACSISAPVRVSPQVVPQPTPMPGNTATQSFYDYRQLESGTVRQANNYTAPKPEAVRTARAADYSWIRGKLEYSGLGGGIWKLRYDSVQSSDKYGGSVILDKDPAQAGLRSGDLVMVEGQVHERPHQSGLASPIYRVRDIFPVKSSVPAPRPAAN